MYIISFTWRSSSLCVPGLISDFTLCYGKETTAQAQPFAYIYMGDVGWAGGKA